MQVFLPTNYKVYHYMQVYVVHKVLCTQNYKVYQFMQVYIENTV
jgi:hypothetical protein